MTASAGSGHSSGRAIGNESDWAVHPIAGFVSLIVIRILPDNPVNTSPSTQVLTLSEFSVPNQENLHRPA